MISQNRKSSPLRTLCAVPATVALLAMFSFTQKPAEAPKKDTKTTKLEEVVVVGYGTNIKDIDPSTKVYVDGKEIAIDQLDQVAAKTIKTMEVKKDGQVKQIRITTVKASADGGQATKMLTQGEAFLVHGGKAPKIYFDGKELTEGTTLDQLDPAYFGTVNVIRDSTRNEIHITSKEGSMKSVGKDTYVFELKANQKPKIMLDGKEFNGTMNELDPKYIESVDVKKDGETSVINVKSRDPKKVILAEDQKGKLEEVVVIGYGTQKKDELTGQTNIIMLDKDKKPVVYVDGKKYDGDLQSVDPRTIADVNVKKDGETPEVHITLRKPGETTTAQAKVIDMTFVKEGDNVYTTSRTVSATGNAGQKRTVTITQKDGKNVVSVDGKEVTEDEYNDLMKKLEAQQPGITKKIDDLKGNSAKKVMFTTEGTPASITIRGISLDYEYTDGNAPMFILDGKKVTGEQFKNIDSKSIDSISVLKDESAVKTYGAEGKNGVVIITTKKAAAKTKK